MRHYSIWIGFDPREAAAFAVAKQSILRWTRSAPIHGLVLDDLQKEGHYTRPTAMVPSAVDGPILIDEISKTESYSGAMSTQFAISRFLVPHLAQTGMAMFVDCDVMFRANPMPMMYGLDSKYALYCVKHQYNPSAGMKMDGREQSAYDRKNWSSVMIFNCDHPANKRLTLDMVNMRPGRDLHRFYWLEDEEIGELDPGWNWLVGEQPEPENPKVVHYTMGWPGLKGYENVPYSNEWRALLNRWAA